MTMVLKHVRCKLEVDSEILEQVMDFCNLGLLMAMTSARNRITGYTKILGK